VRILRVVLLLAGLALSLLAAPTAGAVTMSLKSVTVTPTPGSAECCLQGGQGEWTYTKEGQTAKRQNASFTGTWGFPMPATIPEGGVNVPLKVTAHVESSNYAPFMRLDSTLITNGTSHQRIDLGTPLADNNPDSPSKQDEQATYDMKLMPFAGKHIVHVGASDGPKWQYTYESDPTPQPTPTPTPTPAPTVLPGPVKPAFQGCRRRPFARAAAINEVRVIAVNPDVAVHKAGTPEDQWCSVEKDTVLQQGDEISCDPDGAVQLQFADNSTVVIRNTTQLKIASFFTEGGVVRTEILLKMGEVAAQVHKSEATKSDFRIKSPTGTTSVRGTKFTVNHDPGANRTLTSVTEGVVAVTDLKGKETLVTAGNEVITTAKGAGKVAKLGKAGLRGGVSAIAALAKVMKLIAKADEACGVELPIGNAYSTKETRGGWKVAVKLVGKRKGTARWTVKGRKAKASGALARAITKRCR
jgi:hypothetical protein